MNYYYLINRTKRNEDRALLIGISIPGYTFFLNGTKGLTRLESWERLIDRQYNKNGYVVVTSDNVNMSIIDLDDLLNDMRYRVNRFSESRAHNIYDFLEEEKTRISDNRQIDLIAIDEVKVIRIISNQVINHKLYPLDIFTIDISKFLLRNYK